jgi:hypothetical protein
VIGVTASRLEERVGFVLNDCDPDLSRTPAWRSSGQRRGPGMRSTLVLLALMLATAYLAVGGFALVLAVPAGVVALLTAWALARRAVRLVMPAAAPGR